MKNILLVMWLGFVAAGCATTDQNPVKATVDGAYEATQEIEQAVWDAM